MSADDPLRLSATALAARIRAGRLRARDAVEAHVARIAAVNPRINAVVRDRFAAARAEADTADARVAAGETDLPPLHGVPCTIKEAFALTGMPWTSGLVSRRGIVAGEDAPAVARLRAAGAIPLGVTNTSELCMWMESSNRVWGRTANPYDATRTCGGSSGGEGAIVGAGGSPFGLGSDVGGSIRMPAFFGGVFGHKPSPGIVPNAGQHPDAEGVAQRYLCTGPLARRAEDLMPLLRILAGDAAPALGDPGAVRLDELEVLVVAPDRDARPSAELTDAIARARRHLESRGARSATIDLPALRHALDVWSAMMHDAGGATFRELLGGGQPIATGRELVRWALGRSPHTFPALGLAVLERLPELTPGRTRRFVETGVALRAAVHARLGRRGVLLYPPYPTPAPKHGRALLPPIRWTRAAIFNVLELPVTQVPLGLATSGRHRGLPLGVQVAAAPGNDHLTIAVALELERAFGGWTPPDDAR